MLGVRVDYGLFMSGFLWLCILQFMEFSDDTSLLLPRTKSCQRRADLKPAHTSI